jgi:hypothetical protein
MMAVEALVALQAAAWSKPRRRVEQLEQVRSHESVQSHDAIALQRQDLNGLRCVALTVWCSAVQAERGLRISSGF